MLRVWCVNDGVLWSRCQHCRTGWMQPIVEHKSAAELHHLSRHLCVIINQWQIKTFSCHLVFVENCYDPMTYAMRSTLSLILTPETLLFRIKGWIVVQDLNYNQNEGPVYQDWGPSLETRPGEGGSWMQAFVQLMTDHLCWQGKTKPGSASVSWIMGTLGRQTEHKLH